MDLTVNNADEVRDFYKAVVGWGTEEVEMGGYSDYSMTVPGNGQGVAGVCWKRGGNADLPSVWLIYITVPDIEQSIAKLKDLGGKVLVGPKTMGEAKYCVFEDPAGAKAALYQPAPK